MSSESANHTKRHSGKVEIYAATDRRKRRSLCKVFLFRLCSIPTSAWQRFGCDVKMNEGWMYVDGKARVETGVKQIDAQPVTSLHLLFENKVEIDIDPCSFCFLIRNEANLFEHSYTGGIRSVGSGVWWQNVRLLMHFDRLKSKSWSLLDVQILSYVRKGVRSHTCNVEIARRFAGPSMLTDKADQTILANLVRSSLCAGNWIVLDRRGFPSTALTMAIQSLSLGNRAEYSNCSFFSTKYLMSELTSAGSSLKTSINSSNVWPLLLQSEISTSWTISLVSKTGSFFSLGGSRAAW